MAVRRRLVATPFRRRKPKGPIPVTSIRFSQFLRVDAAGLLGFERHVTRKGPKYRSLLRLISYSPAPRLIKKEVQGKGTLNMKTTSQTIDNIGTRK